MELESSVIQLEKDNAKLMKQEVAFMSCLCFKLGEQFHSLRFESLIM